MARKPRTAEEVALEQAQRQVTLGQVADTERKRLLWKLWEGGMTQKELAERLTRASVAVGGRAISENAVYKLLSHVRREYQQQEDVA